jgi:hypothetical protein
LVEKAFHRGLRNRYGYNGKDDPVSRVHDALAAN